MRSNPVKKEFRKLQSFVMPRSIPAIRMINWILKFTTYLTKTDRNVEIQKKTVTTRDGAKIAIDIFSPMNSTRILPCLVYFPGGGFMMSMTPAHKRNADIIVSRLECKVILVSYRLAPKHLFPTALFDAVDAYKDICARADELGIDPLRIAIGGDSSGGSLTAGVALMMRQENGPRPILQLMLYPALGQVSLNVRSRRKFSDAPVFNTKVLAFINHIVYHNGYFGLKQYAFPLTQESFIDLPPAYIETAEYDCLHGDGIRYAEVLKDAGIAVMLVETKGTYHGYDTVMTSPVVQQCMHQRLARLKAAFGITENENMKVIGA